MLDFIGIEMQEDLQHNIFQKTCDKYPLAFAIIFSGINAASIWLFPFMKCSKMSAALRISFFSFAGTGEWRWSFCIVALAMALASDDGMMGVVVGRKKV